MVADGHLEGEGTDEERGLRERISSQAEDRIGKLADDLLANPVINSALERAFTAREKMAQAQESAMDALNLPSATNIDKLARRLRSMSQRLDEIEDAVERLDRRVETIGAATTQSAKLSERLNHIDGRMDDLSRDVAALRRELAPSDAVPAAQTSAIVPEG
jgi:methyl-accepting chemotaxis protein